MNSPEKDYSHKGWLAAAALIAVLVAVSFVPPQTIGGVKLRRANILADLFDFNDAEAEATESTLFNEADFRVDMQEVAERIEADTLPPKVQTTFEWNISGASASYGNIVPDTALRNAAIVPIETFDQASKNSLQAFCDTLINARRPVRIAFMGDSFVEGDILTADLRERMQETFGGGGPGFAPMASPLTAFRRTVKTQSKGWTAYNIMQRKAAPEALRNNFYISGWVCQPTAGASTRWENTSFRHRLDQCTRSRIFFISPAHSRIEVMVNDTLRREFSVEGDAAVRQIAVTAPRIRSLEFKVLSGAEAFVGYGATLEGDGVVVDNYSVRSNNGQAMFWTNPSVNAQINSMMNYDLVILQYGLNIMQSGVKNYTRYGEQIVKMVAYVRECFPTAAVLVLGVSDRSVKTDTGFEPMDAVPFMTACQRQAAMDAGAAFWSTSEAMRAEGGMAHYVRSGWAGKDFTHINYGGGRRVAKALFEAINAGACEAYDARQKVHARKKAARAIIDTLQLLKIEQDLGPTNAPDSNILRQ